MAANARTATATSKSRDWLGIRGFMVDAKLTAHPDIKRTAIIRSEEADIGEVGLRQVGETTSSFSVNVLRCQGDILGTLG